MMDKGSRKRATKSWGGFKGRATKNKELFWSLFLHTKKGSDGNLARGGGGVKALVAVAIK